MSLVSAISDLAISIASDIKALVKKVKYPLKFYRTFWASTGTFWIPSYWQAASATSQSFAQSTYIVAAPYDCDGLDIAGIGIHVQGGISGTPIIYFGIYDSDPITGAPTNLLAETSLTITSVGTQALSLVIPKENHNGRVWIAWYLKLTSSSVQFSICNAGYLAGLDFILPTSIAGATNLSPKCLVSATAWSASNTMPTTFGTYGFGMSVVCPNISLRVSPPT